ncbi:MAG TPA: TIGR03032 family protein [Allosphingosinicella sp.]|uniref:TIGR03032 family protein n=1 Tax=Allosphingosinicella sp. TaxID=2823234 RepID=UPI002ED8AE8C
MRIRHSPGMAEWLRSQGISLAYTSYASGRLIVAGVEPGGRLFFNEQNYTRAMGLHYSQGELHLASLYQIWRLTDMLQPGEFANGAYDCVLVPRQAHTTGYLDVHELALDGGGRTIFVNSRYSCLATIDAEFSFQPVWKPPFITELAPEDRCHLNGLAMVEGVPRYVTAFNTTNTKIGWRDLPHNEGVVLEIESGEIVARSLSLPHSPRVYEGALWVLESGRGYLVRIDLRSGEKTDVAFCPGFLRGLKFHDGYAVVVVSKLRERSERLPLHDELMRSGAEPWCAVLVIDLKSGLISNFIRYEAGITELFDIALLEGIRNPVTVGPSTEEVLTAIRFNPEFASVDLEQ